MVAAVAVVINLAKVVAGRLVDVAAQVARVLAAAVGEGEEGVDVCAAALAAHRAHLAEVDDGHATLGGGHVGEGLDDAGEGDAGGGEGLLGSGHLR